MKTHDSGPLLCWDLYIEHYHSVLLESRKKQILKDLEVFGNKFDWNFDFKSLIDSTNFDAVVLTDHNQQIQYASQGFKKMTGYPFSYTKGKQPKFLQGEKTCTETRSKIREYILKEKPFQEEVINYKKSGDLYRCLIMVYPIKNIKNVITHFIALEQEIKKTA